LTFGFAGPTAGSVAAGCSNGLALLGGEFFGTSLTAAGAELAHDLTDLV
jgi:hypothetical protein